MSSKSRVDSTTRRQQILQSLAVSPLDAGQLVRLSPTFCDPFTDRLYVLRAMARIVRDGFALEFIRPDKSKYWKPSKEGYQLLYGPDKPLPKRAAFKPVSPSLMRHTRRLADLAVAIQVSALRDGYTIIEMHGDHQIRLKLGDQTKIPDLVVKLRKRINGRKHYFTLMFELDCGTEWGYTSQGEDSINRMIDFYLTHRASCKDDYRVVMLFDKPTMRLPHFVERVEQINTDPRRQPIKAGLLDDVLRLPSFLETPLLRDPRNDAVPMIGAAVHAQGKIPQVKMDFAMAR